MKKAFILCMFLWFNLFFLQGCGGIKVDTGETIVPPGNKLISIKGIWKVETIKRIHPEGLTQKKEDEWLGEKAIFDEKIAVLGEEICPNPEYKMKIVSAKNYFLYTYGVDYRDLGIDSKIVEVFSITSEDKHFYDLIKINEQEILVYHDNDFFYLQQIANKTAAAAQEEKLNKNLLSKTEKMTAEPNLLRSGLMLGLRSISLGDGGVQKISYRTLWIAAKNRSLYPIEEIQNLYVPRKSGFWTVGIRRKNQGGFFRDDLFTVPLEIKKEKQEVETLEEESKKKMESLKENIEKRIAFIGNDYAAVEYARYSVEEATPWKTLQMIPLDNIEKDLGIYIGDVAGEEGRNILRNSAQAYLSNLSSNERQKFEQQIREDHFTLARRSGHWIMKGRLYYKDYSDKNAHGYLEYNINMIPPVKLVNYDELHLSWNKIKERVPEALDAYTSPNKDLAVIITKEMIYVYGFKNGELANKYLEKLKLREGETVVMAEWATGNYVEKWAVILHDPALNISSFLVN